MITRSPAVGHVKGNADVHRPPEPCPRRLQFAASASQVAGRTLSVREGTGPPVPEEGPRSMSTATHRPATRSQMELPGQKHVAEGPLDLTGMYMAHHAFRRDLARFA